LRNTVHTTSAMGLKEGEWKQEEKQCSWRMEDRTENQEDSFFIIRAFMWYIHTIHTITLLSMSAAYYIVFLISVLVREL
jgi:hypothetical protein